MHQSTPTQGNNSKELIQRHIILLDDAQSYLHEMLQKNAPSNQSSKTFGTPRHNERHRNNIPIEKFYQHKTYLDSIQKKND